MEWAVTGECTHCGPLMATESAGTPEGVAPVEPAVAATPLRKEAFAADQVEKLAQLRARMAASGASSSYLSGLDQQIDEELSSLQQMTGKPLALDHGRLVNPAIGDRERHLANGTSVTPPARPMPSSTGGSEMVDSGLGLLTRPAVEEKAWSTVSGDRSGEVNLGPYLMEQDTDGAKKVDLNLKYKDGWTNAQKAAADAKCQVLCDANTVVTQAQRSGTSASSRYKRAGNTVSPGDDVDHSVDLQLGGADSVSNMLPLNSSVNRSLGSQIHHQIKNLPAGTVVDKVNIQ
ncbi:hypothetical protein EZI54_23325 [Marinobacter halodurans]|uniref:HNH endonuclease n=1 Tax=Marinobacter halodurans TaxID=2528979 RepID=A0ABY1ZDB4_9GAMM|nr:hypothetical protein EZI54_23325 [Marinobacter halodurans]